MIAHPAGTVVELTPTDIATTPIEDDGWPPQERLVCEVRGDNAVLGYVAIDTTFKGHARGGLRMLPDLDAAELQHLARSMTLKYSFLGLGQGGAKAGVYGDPDLPLAERRRCLRRFGRAIAPLLQSHSFMPGADMGTDNEDIRDMLDAVGVRVRGRELTGSASGHYTALTVLAGAAQAARRVGKSMAGCTAVIEGFGKVGTALARLLHDRGVRIVAVSTSQGALVSDRGLDVDRLVRLEQESGSRVIERYGDADRVPRSSILELPVDLLLPCARHHSINEANMGSIMARAISAGANNPLTPAAERALTSRGVLCLPDFVTNSGGVLGGTMHFAAVPAGRIDSLLPELIGAKVAALLDESERSGVSPRQVAVAHARRRFDELRRSDRGTGILSHVLESGLELHRRGWLPGALVGRLAVPFLTRRLA